MYNISNREVIQTLLNRVDINDIDLWFILSALRGPDSNPIDKIDEDISRIKRATTAVIRWKLGLNQYYFSSNPDNSDLLNIRLTADFKTLVGGHFTQHAKNAFNALGLDWYKVNY